MTDPPWPVPDICTPANPLPLATKQGSVIATHTRPPLTPPTFLNPPILPNATNPL